MDIDYKVGEVKLIYKTTTPNKHKINMSCDAYNLLLPTFKEGTIEYKEYFKVIFLPAPRRYGKFLFVQWR